MKEVFQKLFYRRESRDDGAIVIQPKYYLPKRYGCGHTAAGSYEIIAHDLSFTSEGFGAGHEGLCPDCAADELMRSIIKCVNCAKPIVPGQIVLVVYAEPDDALKSGVHFLDGGKNAVMCCGPSCSQGDLTGRWNGRGVDKFKI
ncbi:MAG: hypothetical protein U0487_01230 [Patescibacteria group bacterium]